MNRLKLWQLYRLRARALRSGDVRMVRIVDGDIAARIAAIGGGL